MNDLSFICQGDSRHTSRMPHANTWQCFSLDFLLLALENQSLSPQAGLLIEDLSRCFPKSQAAVVRLGTPPLLPVYPPGHLVLLHTTKGFRVQQTEGWRSNDGFYVLRHTLVTKTSLYLCASAYITQPLGQTAKKHSLGRAWKIWVRIERKFFFAWKQITIS